MYNNYTLIYTIYTDELLKQITKYIIIYMYTNILTNYILTPPR